MNCKEIRELLPAYVLGALDGGDAADVETHLRTGREHDDELVELRATVFALDRYGDVRSLEAPPALQPSRAPALARASSALRSIWSVPLWRAASVAAAAFAIFAAGWLISGVSGNGSHEEVYATIKAPGGQSVALSADASEQRVEVTMSGFAALPPDQVYQLWAIRDDTWLRIGVCTANASGGWTGEFPFKLRPGDAIAMTVEPTGGSDSPTTEPLLISRS